MVVSIAHLVEVTDSAVLGGVAEVVSSNATVGHKNIFQHLPAYLIYIYTHTRVITFQGMRTGTGMQDLLLQ